MMCKRWYDDELAEEWLSELAKTCDQDCMKQGTQWSVALSFNGVTMILLALTYIGFAFGAYSFATRMIATCLNCTLGII